MKFLLLLALGLVACAFADPAMEMEWKAEYGNFGLNHMQYLPLTFAPSTAPLAFTPAKIKTPLAFTPSKLKAPLSFTTSKLKAPLSFTTIKINDPLSFDLSEAYPYAYRVSSYHPEHFYETRGYYPENK